MIPYPLPFTLTFVSLQLVAMGSTVLSATFTWTDSNDGLVRWSPDCDFASSNIGNQQSVAQDCGGICLALAGCTHFTWTDHNSGTCWLKGGGTGTESTAVAKNDGHSVCGFIRNRVTTFTWFDSNDVVRWARGCDFDGSDIGNQLSPSEKCGGICVSRSDCTHFTWTDYNSGTCWVKGGGFGSEVTAIAIAAKTTDNIAGVCGFVKNRVQVQPAQPKLRWPYGQQPVRGVNVGSWLVLEKWMAPGPFAGLPNDVNDEYKLCQHLGYQAAEEKLRNHWNTWFTETDVIYLKSAGVNHLRIPIGYWTLDIRAGEPWVAGSWEYVVKACQWARTHGLKVMIDLHGAPGSQNGNDHSGQSGSIEFFKNPNNVRRAVTVLGRIARAFSAEEWRNTVTIIELLNEPILWGSDYDSRLRVLKDFYRLGYDEIRKYNNEVVVAVHDAFISYDNWYFLRDDPHFYWVMLDAHIYQVFGEQWGKMTCEQHYGNPCTLKNSLTSANAKLWTVVGEWSLAMPNNLRCNDKATFAKQQIGVYESASGWFFWAYKHGQGWKDWSFEESVKEGWINLAKSNQASC